MIRKLQTTGAPRQALLAVLALATLPGNVIAAEPSARVQPEALQRQLEEARQRLENSSREVAELSRVLGRQVPLFISASGTPPRALLGIGVVDGADRKGAQVERVSPGGAAAEAGIQAGDLITSLDGLDLTSERQPANALVERMTRIEPDRKIRIEVVRDGSKLAVDVVPRMGAGPDLMRGGRAEAIQGQLDQLRLRYNDNHPQVRALIEGGSGIVGGPVTGTGAGTPFGGMEFASLSEGLGKYFGVSSGVLVVRAGTESPYSLQDGDVILQIDGRAPTNAQHAARILRSYQAGEQVKLRVQRERRAINLDTTAPGGRRN